MVHRAPDSRLLSSLVTVETTYSKHLQAVLSHSSPSLAALSAYAAASAPPVSQVIIAVAECFARADDALGAYINAVDEWRDCLNKVKDAEEDVSGVLRDREILVTRLLKASKAHKPNRDSLINIRASVSETSLASTSLTPSNKLSIAQAELQACEAHLAAKEHQLEQTRVSLIRKGLETRCKAMVECAYTCGEVGREALRALDGVGVGDAPNSSDRFPYKVLPIPEHVGEGGPPSDLSSLTPSQSASQTGLSTDGATLPSSSSTVHVHIPPAHSISDYAWPRGIARRITEEPEEEEEGGSSEGEEEGPVEVRENERFAQPAVKSSHTFSIRGDKHSGHVRFPTSVSDVGPVWRDKERDSDRSSRGRSASLFSGIATLFRGRGTSPDKSSKKRWQTRTEKNLRRGDSSSEDEAPTRAGSSTDAGTHRLKKKPSKKGESLRDKGWMSDGVVGGDIGRGNVKAKGKQPNVNSVFKDQSTGYKDRNVGFPDHTSKGKNLKPILNISTTDASGSGSGTLSRDSSISRRSVLSTASAPIPTRYSPTKGPKSATVTGSASVTSNGKRGSSLEYHRPGSSPLASSPGVATWAGSAHQANRQTPGSSSTLPINNSLNGKSKKKNDGVAGVGQQSLMSIVEGVSNMNRAGRSGVEPSLEIIKAPAPISRSQLDTAIEGSMRGSLRSSPGPSNSEDSGTIGPSRRPSRAQGTVILTAHSPVRGMVPLRSALRNHSRSPSPIPVQRSQYQFRGPSSNLAHVEGAKPSSSYANGSAVQAVDTGEADDAASMSSYETGHEVFDEDDPGPPPPPHDPVLSDVSSSTASTATKVNNGSARRKSVRMSLQPTFSPTPPALDEYDNSSHHAPWSDPSGWNMRNGQGAGLGIKDMWEDSSGDEDEEYKTARKLLTRVGKKI